MTSQFLLHYIYNKQYWTSVIILIEYSDINNHMIKTKVTIKINYDQFQYI